MSYRGSSRDNKEREGDSERGEEPLQRVSQCVPR